MRLVIDPFKLIVHRLHALFILTVLGVLTVSSSLSAQWEPDVQLSLGSANAYTSFNHEHNMATTGDTVHAVWFDARHGWPNAEIYYRRSLDRGENWESEMRLTDDGIYSGYPSIAAVGQTLHVVWFSSDNDDDNIHYIRSTNAGVTWEPDTQLTTNIVMQDFPAVAASGSHVHVVYHDERNGNWEVYYLRSTDAGVTWGPEVRLTSDAGWSNNAGILVHDQYVHVTWSDDRASTTDFDIYYKRSSDYGVSWGPDTRLTFTLNSGAPSPAMSGQNLYIAFQSERDGNTEMFFKRSTNNGIDWLADVQLTNDPALRQLPAIAASDSNIHIVWQDYRSSVLPEIYYKRSTDFGVTWDADLRLTDDSLRSIWPGVAVGDSVVHVIWSDDRPGYYSIFYKRNPTGNPTGIDEYQVLATHEMRASIHLYPNPFKNHGRIFAHEDEWFRVYDVCGKMVATCRGDLIGEGLDPGVYFIRSQLDNTRTRFVKIE